MTEIIHLDCGLIESPAGPACCHCVALIDGDRVALIDTGIGVLDCRDPQGRLGRELIDAVGFRVDEDRTALRQLERLGFASDQIGDIVLTHADPDHTGGLADFPDATIHIAAEELAAVRENCERYRLTHFEHGPRWCAHPASSDKWNGLGARPVAAFDGKTVLLVELFGHTAGHCGVAVERDGGWFLHAGDAYYLRAELDDPAHPAGELARSRAVDDAQRIASLDHLRRLRDELGEQLTMTGYHDNDEFAAFGRNLPR